MQTLNVRLGFAANSSSTHSVVLPRKGRPQKDFDFGCQDFVQATAAEKTSYLAQTLYGELAFSLGEEIALAVVNDVFPEAAWDPENGCVDHQSSITVPRRVDQKLCLQFFQELAGCLINDSKAVILGGSDFKDRDIDDENSTWQWLRRLADKHSGEIVVRKSADGVWVVFNTSTGLKWHVRFDATPVMEPPHKPEAPELVDVKITDYCTHGCAFCYQGSTADGAHAKLRDIEELIRILASAEVFEVVLGGGEPTEHPHFAAILHMIREAGMVPSFTTNSTWWYQDRTIADAVWQCCGAVAHSLNGVRGVRDIALYPEAVSLLHPGARSPRLMFQYIPELCPLHTLREVAKSVKDNTLVLLGYKQLGRANKPAPYRHPEMFKLLREMQAKGEMSCAIGIDTKLAQDYRKELKAAKIPKELYYVDEGRLSMYVDAVQHRFGRSSYDGDLTTYEHEGEVLDAFKRWNAEC